MKKLVPISILIIGCTSFPALAAETYESSTKIEKGNDGNYNETTTIFKTEADGTTKRLEKHLTTEGDGSGNIDKILSTESITDPQGLGNKHIIKITDREQTKGGQVTTTHTKTIDGKNIEGTTDHFRSESKVKTDSLGNYAERDITVNTDANGTMTSFEKNANVGIDARGNINKITTTKQVTDPKDSLDKETVTTTNAQTTSDGLVTTKQDVTVNGKTIESKSETKQQ